MSDDEKRILQMLAEGKISVAEAQRLLSLINRNRASANDQETTSKDSSVKYLRVVVEPKSGALERRHGRVNVRVPFGLIRAGIKLATLIPPEAADKVNYAMKEKGMSFDVRNLKTEDLEAIIAALRESEINVDTEDETVKVYAE